MPDSSHCQLLYRLSTGIVLLGLAAMLGACALRERPRTVPPVGYLRFEPAYDPQTVKTYATEDLAPTRAVATHRQARGRTVEKTVGMEKKLSGSTDKTTKTRDPVKMCYDAWHEHTHIDREQWREICSRSKDIPRHY